MQPVSSIESVNTINLNTDTSRQVSSANGSALQLRNGSSDSDINNASKNSS